jgi:hypothetical protein
MNKEEWKEQRRRNDGSRHYSHLGDSRTSKRLFEKTSQHFRRGWNLGWEAHIRWLAKNEEPKPQRKTCQWKLNEGDYDTSCGVCIVFEVSVEDARYKYCPYCGRNIEVVE